MCFFVGPLSGVTLIRKVTLRVLVPALKLKLSCAIDVCFRARVLGKRFGFAFNVFFYFHNDRSVRRPQKLALASRPAASF